MVFYAVNCVMKANFVYYYSKYYGNLMENIGYESKRYDYLLFGKFFSAEIIHGFFVSYYSDMAHRETMYCISRIKCRIYLNQAANLSFYVA